MGNEQSLNHYTEATEFAKDRDIEESEPRQKRVSWCLDDNWHTEYVVHSYEQNLWIISFGYYF